MAGAASPHAGSQMDRQDLPGGKFSPRRVRAMLAARKNYLMKTTD